MKGIVWILLTITAIVRVDSRKLFLKVNASGVLFNFDEDNFNEFQACVCSNTTCSVNRQSTGANTNWVLSTTAKNDFHHSESYSTRHVCSRKFKDVYFLECTRQTFSDVGCSSTQHVWSYRISYEAGTCGMVSVGVVWAKDLEVKFIHNDSVVGVCEAGCNISTTPKNSTEEECTAAQGPGDEDDAANDESITTSTGLAVGVSVAGVVVVVAVVVAVLVTFACKRKRRAVTGKRRSGKKDSEKQNANGATKDEGSYGVQDISMLVEQEGSNYCSLETDQNYSTTAISASGKLDQPSKVIPNSYASQSEYSEVGESFCKVDAVNDRSNGRAVVNTGNSVDVMAYACSNLAVSNTENSEYSKLHDVVRNFTDVYSVLPPSGDDGT